MDRVAEFFKQYQTERFSKGSTIIHQDALPTTSYAVKEGVAKIYNLTAHGEEKLIGFVAHMGVLPLGWVLGAANKSQYYYEAYSDCTLYRVPRKDYVAFLKDNPTAMFETLERSVKDILQYQMRINALGQSRAFEKVLNTIHYLSLCFGHDLMPDVVEIPLPLTQQDIANCVGVTRETTTVELRKLIAKKVISHRGHNYVVHTDKLNQLLDDDYEHWLIRQPAMAMS